MGEGWCTYATFGGPIVMVGFGSIGQGALPLLLRHLDVPRDAITIVCPDTSGRAIADDNGVRFIAQALTPDTLRAVLEPLLGRGGGFLVNLSVDVSSHALMEVARSCGALYIDTCIEPWPGGYTDPSKPLSERTNYGLREDILALRAAWGGQGPTALVAHGANPGLVSHFVKEALLTVARDVGHPAAIPTNREGWARLAQVLCVKGIHIAERDTQIAHIPKRRGEFVNTWSVDGFVAEGLQPAELGWGTHENGMPAEGAHHPTGCRAAIYLKRPGAGTRVRSWTPGEGPYQGFLITHNESISIADFLTVRDDRGMVAYRPTVHYAYHPCDDAVLSLHEMAGRNWRPQPAFRLMNDEIVHGMDELGVLVFGHARNALWYGSQLTIEQTRILAPHQNATGLQVTAAVLAGMVWCIENPNVGIMEADEIDHRRILDLARPYLGTMTGAYTDWTPLDDRGGLFPDPVDTSDPWQFANVLVQ
ncbi:MAG: homospermidine synthase [Rhodospirillaceae bacterium BRH_c57]|nr:MAG: homospermidine synthase [Rhodospirillaceae bacterium BRH_c57]